MLTISEERITELLEKCNGYGSAIYPLIKDRLTGYREEDIAFAEEGLFFEEEYLLILKHIKQNQIPVERVVDIGCLFGFQSELFDGVEYIGVEALKVKFFNQEKSSVRYIRGVFPYVDVDLKNAVTISSMALGYFNEMVDEDEEKALDKIVEKLAECSRLYIKTTPELIERLKPLFKIHEELMNERVLQHSFFLYYFSNMKK